MWGTGLALEEPPALATAMPKTAVTSATNSGTAGRLDMYRRPPMATRLGSRRPERKSRRRIGVGQRNRSRFAGPALALAALLAGAAPAAAAPILPTGLPPSLPAFQGAAATAQPVKPTIAPQNPFMAANPNSNIHNDSWMTDAYRRRGPLGRSLVSGSEGMPPAVCGSLAFDSRGRIVPVCPS